MTNSDSKLPPPVLAAFVSGEEAEVGALRSVRRLHDTAGPIHMLLHDTLPIAIRREDADGVRVDVLNSLRSDLLTLECAYVGARVGRVIEWQLMNVLRGRSVRFEKA